MSIYSGMMSHLILALRLEPFIVRELQHMPRKACDPPPQSRGSSVVEECKDILDGATRVKVRIKLPFFNSLL